MQVKKPEFTEEELRFISHAVTVVSFLGNLTPDQRRIGIDLSTRLLCYSMVSTAVNHIESEKEKGKLEKSCFGKFKTMSSVNRPFCKANCSSYLPCIDVSTENDGSGKNVSK